MIAAHLLRPVLWAVMIVGTAHSQAVATQATAAATAPVVAVAAPSPTVQSGPQPLNPSITTTMNGYPVTYGAQDLTGPPAPPARVYAPIPVVNVPDTTGPLPGDQGCALGPEGC